MAKKKAIKEELSDEIAKEVLQSVVESHESKKLSFPMWLYSKDGSILVKNQEHYDSLGKGYSDSPAAFEKE